MFNCRRNVVLHSSALPLVILQSRIEYQKEFLNIHKKGIKKRQELNTKNGGVLLCFLFIAIDLTA